MAMVRGGSSRFLEQGTHCYALRPARPYVVLLKLLDGELGLHQVVVEDDDLPAQRSLLVVVVLRLTTEDVDI